MPHYSVKKVTGKTCYEVKNDKTKVIAAKCTTLARGKAQAKLLNQMDHRIVEIKKK